MQGCYHDGGARFPEGVPSFLGKIEWGCQISWDAKYPVTAPKTSTSSA